MAMTSIALTICIVPVRPVVLIFQFDVRRTQNARMGTSPRIMLMDHVITSLQTAIVICVIANLPVAGVNHAVASHPNHTERLKHRDLIKSKEIFQSKTAGKKETTVCSVFKRNRSDGRLSPWDDIHPPAKKPRRKDPLTGGLPWDDVEAPQKKDQREPAGSSNVKQVIVVDHEPVPSSNSKQTESSENITKEPGETTDAKWNQAEMEANAFLEAFGRDLVECPEPDASANSQIEGGCESPPYSPAWSALCATQYHLSEDPVPADGEDICMADVPGEITKSTRSTSCEIDENPPRSDPVIVPFQTLKPLQRNPPYDSGVLNLFRGKENNHVYVNLTRRSNAVEMYVETAEEECTTTRMSHLTV
ncbi:WD40 repeatcontaining protein [Colletotrichum tofieldiae]|nr:WD40 repeatcontaining protein [Colletotrichum tofieldiae]